MNTPAAREALTKAGFTLADRESDWFDDEIIVSWNGRPVGMLVGYGGQVSTSEVEQFVANAARMMAADA